MKQFKNIDETLIAVLKGTASSKELEHFRDWLNSSQENEIQFEYLKKIWNERSSEVKFFHAEELEEKIWQQGVVEEGKVRKLSGIRKKENFRYFFKVASVVLIFLAAPYLLYLYSGDMFKEKAPVEISMITKSNPAGQKSKINLPDGSVVWLNSLSSINYPEFFSDSSRILELTGEAYFEVKKDSLRPFTVKSADLTTTALGTSFNITAYPEENEIKVGLITGRVVVQNKEFDKEIILNVNQGAVYHKSQKEMVGVKIDPELLIAWKNGILRFNGENFQEFINKLEKWYGVDIAVKGESPENWSIRGEFADEYLSNILTSISFNKEFSYTINRKEVILEFKE